MAPAEAPAAPASEAEQELGSLVVIGCCDCACGGCRTTAAMRAPTGCTWREGTVTLGDTYTTLSVSARHLEHSSTRSEPPRATLLSLRSGPDEGERELACDVALSLARLCSSSNRSVVVACCLRLTTLRKPGCADLSPNQCKQSWPGTDHLDPIDHNSPVLDGFVSQLVHALQFAGARALLVAMPSYRCDDPHSCHALAATDTLGEALAPLLPAGCLYSADDARQIDDVVLPHKLPQPSSELMYA